MKPGKSPIGGRQITRKEAFKGLGDPKTWQNEAKAVYAEFRAKPAHPKETVLKKALAGKSRPQLEPVYAKKMKRRSAKNRKTRNLRGRKR